MKVATTAPAALPGPRPMPMLGALGNLIPLLLDPTAYMDRLYQNYGGIVSLARGMTDYVLVFAPEYNQQVLGNTALFHNHDARSTPLRMRENSALTRLFTGLTQMNGAKHKQQRRLMAPALSRKCIAAYSDDIIAVTMHKCAGWRAGQQRDLLREMRQLTLALAVKTFVGLDPGREGEVLCQLLEQWMHKVFSIPAILFPVDVPGTPYHRLLALSRDLEREIVALIERKRASRIDRGDVLSMLLRAHGEDGDALTDEELVGQTATLFVAGHEITARALTWTLFLLAQHPRVMADLLDELDGKSRGALATEQLDDCPLLEGVIKESMRVLPPVMWWSRVSTAPFELGPYSLPEGTTVIVSHYITHRLPDLYPQPARFVPGRWLTIRPGPYEYMPFSAGPRMCLGAALAMLEMKLVLALLLPRYRLTLRPGARIDRGGLMLSAPKHGLPMLIAPQDRRFTGSSVRGNIRAVVDFE